MLVESDIILKSIGASTMLLDHIGYYLFPKEIALRCIGRFAFPIFTYLLCKGWKRGNKLILAINLFIFGIIANYPTNLTGVNNILWTLLFYTGILYCYDLFKGVEGKILTATCGLFISEFYEYNYYGFLMLSYWYLIDNSIVKRPIKTGIWITGHIIYSYISHDYIQIIAIYAMPIIKYFETWNKEIKVGINIKKAWKYFFYIFYPLHLYLIYKYGHIK